MKKPKVTKREAKTEDRRLALQQKVRDILRATPSAKPDLEETAVRHLRMVCPDATIEEIADAMHGVCSLAFINGDPVTEVIDVLLEAKRRQAGVFTATDLDTIDGMTCSTIRAMVTKVRSKTSFSLKFALRILL